MGLFKRAWNYLFGRSESERRLEKELQAAIDEVEGKASKMRPYNGKKPNIWEVYRNPESITRQYYGGQSEEVQASIEKKIVGYQQDNYNGMIDLDRRIAHWNKESKRMSEQEKVRHRAKVLQMDPYWNRNKRRLYA